MPNTHTLHCKALSAHELLIAWTQVATDSGILEQVRIEIDTNIRGFRLQSSSQPDRLAAEPAIIAFSNNTESRPTIRALSGSFSIARFSTPIIRYTTADHITGIIEPDFSSHSDRQLELHDAVQRAFNARPYSELVSPETESEVSDALAVRLRATSDMQETVKRLMDFLANLAMQEQAKRAEMQAAMDEAHRKRADELDREYRERQGDLDRAHQTRVDELDAKQRELIERTSQFETREAKYMRRDLLKKINETLTVAESTALSTPTSRKRWWVHCFALVLLVGSGTLAGFMAYRVFQADAPNWHHLAPMSAAFFTAVLTMVYYLKWNDRWFREHADSEFSAKRYKADILRASWVAELMSEWAKEGKGDLPPELIAAFTKNLFAAVGPSRVSEHPIDHLTAIMKRATEFNIGKGVFSVRSSTPMSGPAPR